MKLLIFLKKFNRQFPKVEGLTWVSFSLYVSTAIMSSAYQPITTMKQPLNIFSELMEANGFEFIFFGYNDRANEGEWVWSDGKPTSYLNWKLSEGQPDDYGRNQDCGSMSVTSRWNGTWDDYWCSHSKTFFCQMDLYDWASFCDNRKQRDMHILGA